MAKSSNTQQPAKEPPADTAQPDPAKAQAPEESSGATPSNGADPATSANAAGPGGDQSTDPAAASVSTAAEGGAAADPSASAPGISEPEPELVLGQPAMIEILSGHVAREDVFAGARFAAGITVEEWDAVSEPARRRAVELVVATMRGNAPIMEQIKALLAPSPEGFMMITARSADGQPFRRCGHVWTDKAQTLPIPAADEARVRQDPNLVITALD